MWNLSNMSLALVLSPFTLRARLCCSLITVVLPLPSPTDTSRPACWTWKIFQSLKIFGEKCEYLEAVEGIVRHLTLQYGGPVPVEEIPGLQHSVLIISDCNKMSGQLSYAIKNQL